MRPRLACALLAIALIGCGESRPSHASSGTAGRQKSPACVVVGGNGVAATLDIAKCLSEPLQDSLQTQRPVALVKLYLDRSASMQGFLDPSFPTQEPTDYRSVLDRLVVHTVPDSVFSFGTKIVPASGKLSVVGDRAFYQDKNTDVNAVLHIIARDSQLSYSHVIVGDGRRGSPLDADGQYVEMRDRATQWIAKGGTFIVGASMASFRNVAADPSGCRRDTPKTSEEQRCPLYAFVFAAPQDVRAMTSAIASVFQHIFVWPLPVIPATAFEAVSDSQNTFTRQWVKLADNSYVGRISSSGVPVKKAVTVRLRANPALAAEAYAAMFGGQRITATLTGKPLDTVASGMPWTSLPQQIAVAPDTADSTLAMTFFSYGEGAAHTMVKVELFGRGIPAWLPLFDAVDAQDRLRTYGLGRLFESFIVNAKAHPVPAARLFFVVN